MARVTASAGGADKAAEHTRLRRSRTLLVQTVGTGVGVHNSLLKSIRKREPDCVLQLCSLLTIEKPKAGAKARDADSTLVAFDRQWARRRRSLAAVEVVRHFIWKNKGQLRRLTELLGCPPQGSVADHDDIESVSNAFAQAISLTAHAYGADRIEFDFTAGTKAMSAAAVYSGMVAGVDQFLYVTGPRDEHGRVIRSDRVVTVSFDRLSVGHRLARLEDLFRAHRFATARLECESLLEVVDAARTSVGSPGLRVAAAHAMALALEEWDRFMLDGRCVRALLRPSSRQSCEQQGWKLAAFIDHVLACRSELSSHRLAMLLGNARRRRDEYKFDDAVARCYRLIEYIGQVRLSRVLGETRLAARLNADHVHEIERRDAEAGRICRDRVRGRHFALPLYATHQVLQRLGDPYAAVFVDRYGQPEHDMRRPLYNLLDMRNLSFLAHGSRAVAPEKLEELLAQCRSLLEVHCDSDGESFASVIAAAELPVCPSLTVSPSASGAPS